MKTIDKILLAGGVLLGMVAYNLYEGKDKEICVYQNTKVIQAPYEESMRATTEQLTISGKCDYRFKTGFKYTGDDRE